MILTCPDCATRYFLHDVLIGRAGRTVKCTNCGNSWRAEAEPDEPLPLAEPAPEPASKAEPEPLSALSAAKLSKTVRAQAQVQQKVREAAATGAIWAGLAAGAVMVVAMAAVFRMDVVRLWPKTASAYAAVGMPVNLTGLIIEQVKAAPGAEGDHVAVQVSGVMRNISDRTVAPPPLRVSLLGKDGHSLAKHVSPAPGPALKPGETRRFTVSVADPPKASSDVEVTFALDTLPAGPPPRTAGLLKLRGPAPAAGPGAPPAPALAAPAPPAPKAPAARDAKPLPSESPYALPSKAPA